MRFCVVMAAGAGPCRFSGSRRKVEMMPAGMHPHPPVSLTAFYQSCQHTMRILPLSDFLSDCELPEGRGCSGVHLWIFLCISEQMLNK